MHYLYVMIIAMFEYYRYVALFKEDAATKDVVKWIFRILQMDLLPIMKDES